MIVYVALLVQGGRGKNTFPSPKDISLSNCIMTVQQSKEDLEVYIMDYFGISATNHYDNPSQYLGYKKIEYLDFEDDLDGYYKFRETDGTLSNVYVYSKSLNEKN